MKISIRKTELYDIDKVVSIESNKENSQFISQNSKSEHISLIENKDIDHLLLSVNNKIVGFVVLAGKTNKFDNIEFRRIVISEKGKGYGRMAIQKIKQYCFKEFYCHRLWLDVLENNERAIHLYLSEGFKEEGKLRDCIKINGKYESLIVMSILEDEWVSEENSKNAKTTDRKGT